jgi:outer membrane protein assembly factor BamE (lipoprotein component of BamABCDE complex)
MLKSFVGLLAIVVGVAFLSGCVFIPMFDMPINGTRNAAKHVGDAKSKKPLRVGAATREDVRRILGPPTLAKRDGSSVAYRWSVLEWIVVACGSQDQRGNRMLVLDFDDTGILRAFRIEKASDDPIRPKDKIPEPPAPAGMKPVQ